jgi:hypothetical protein
MRHSSYWRDAIKRGGYIIEFCGEVFIFFQLTHTLRERHIQKQFVYIGSCKTRPCIFCMGSRANCIAELTHDMHGCKSWWGLHAIRAAFPYGTKLTVLFSSYVQGKQKRNRRFSVDRIPVMALSIRLTLIYIYIYICSLINDLIKSNQG